MHFNLERFAFTGWRWALAVVAVIVLGWYAFFSNGSDLGATLTIVPRDFRQEVSVSGTVIATQDVALGFAANGRIAGTYATVGQHVVLGTLLAETENDDLKAALAQKRSALAEAEANLAALRTGTRPEELAVAATTVANAQAALVQAIQNAYTVSDDAVHNKVDAFFTNPRTNPKLSFTVANANLEASIERDRAAIEPILADWAILVTELTADNAAVSAKRSQAHIAQITTLLAKANIALNQGVPDQTTTSATLSSYGVTLATARTNVNAAATTLADDRAALDSAEKNLSLKQAGPTVDAIAAQEAAVAAAQADVQNVQAQLAKTRVTAPFSGIVTRMDAEVGKIVSPTDLLISLQSRGVFQVETFVPEVAIARVMIGNSATTTLDAYGPAVLFPSSVVAVDPAETVKDGVPTYKTTLQFLETDPRIRSGMTANVLIETGLLHDAIVIPAGAVGTKDAGSYVSVVESGSVVPRAVVTGSSPALGQAHILSGLRAGDTILLAPAP